MKLKHWLVALAVAVVAVVFLLVATRGTIKQAAESYVYGYPLVLMDVTQRAFTATRAAPNAIFNVPAFPDSDFREVVRPNVDTLYSIAWLDLAAGPRVFEVPATDRYYVMQFLDGWTNVFASIGPRTTGQGAGVFLIAGPGWDGTVPDGATLLRSPTRIAWLLGRIQTNGIADIGFVRGLQAQLRLRSLEDFVAGSAPTPTAWRRAANAPEPPLFQMRAMNAETYFGALAKLLADNPPAAADGPALEILASLGVRPGQPVEARGWLERKAISLGTRIAARRMQRAAASPSELRAGWSVPPMNIGAYGTEYGLRAVVALAGLGANLPADAVYPNALSDADGEPLSGQRRYVLHFPAGGLPPVRAFWSVTAYDGDGYLIANPAGRYALGDRDPLTFNADGSLDIYVQAEPPDQGRRSNWLPVDAQGAFRITARLYWPEDAILSGDWQMPGIKRVVP
jgi:hypothetical protein